MTYGVVNTLESLQGQAMKISDFARAARCQTDTVRYYEKSGLLPAPGRTPGNYRIYGRDHLIRLRFIRNCRALDMTHAEIRVLLDALDAPDASCAPANAMIKEHLGHVDARILELQRLRAQLRTLQQHCGTKEIGSCSILAALSQLEPPPERPRRTHLG
jgi:Cd(II)/Pb(II)-responsive transcriptional regulator